MADQGPKFYQTEAFKALNEKWKGKLEKSGFSDIERDEDSLENWSTQFARNIEYNRSKEEYYRLAGHFLHSHAFASQRERRVWDLHANGTSIRKIAKILDPRGRKNPHTVFKQVQKTIERLAKEMIRLCQINTD